MPGHLFVFLVYLPNDFPVKGFRFHLELTGNLYHFPTIRQAQFERHPYPVVPKKSRKFEVFLIPCRWKKPIHLWPTQIRNLPQRRNSVRTKEKRAKAETPPVCFRKNKIDEFRLLDEKADLSFHFTV